MREKILFVYESDGEYKIEGIWAKKGKDFYKVDNIPFYIKNIAIGDIVSVEKDKDELFFNEIVKTSGHSTIQIVFFEYKEKNRVLTELENFGCHWEESDNRNLVSIDIAPNINYKAIIQYLEKEVSITNLDYREACIGKKTYN